MMLLSRFRRRLQLEFHSNEGTMMMWVVAFVVLNIASGFPPWAIAQRESVTSFRPDAIDSGYVAVPGTHVKMIPPEGFTLVTTHQGFESASGAAILVTEFHSSFQKFSSDRVDSVIREKRDLILLDNRDTLIDGHHLYLVNCKSNDKRVLFTYMGDSSNTVMFVATFPAELESIVYFPIMKSILTAKLENQKEINSRAGLDFDITERSPFKLAMRFSSFVMYTPNGVIQDSSDKSSSFGMPCLLLGENVTGQIKNLKKRREIAESFTLGAQGIVIEKIVDENEVVIDGLEGYSILAKGRDFKSGGYLTFYQVLLFSYSKMYFLIGVTPDSMAKNSLPLFTEMTKTFKRNELAYVSDGLQLAKDAQYVQMLATLDKAVEVNPHSLKAHIARARANIYLGKLDDALEDCNTAILIDSLASDAYLLKSAIENDDGKFEAAQTDIERAIVIDPRNASAYELRGKEEEAHGKDSLALRDFERAVQVDSGTIGFFLEKGNIEIKLQRNQDAVNDFTRALSLDYRSARAYYFRARAYENMDNNPEALRDLSNAVRFNESFTAAYIERGDLEQSLKQYDEARRDFDKACTISPKEAWPFAARANLSFVLKNDKEAMTDFDRSLDLDKKYAYAYQQRGILKVRLRQYKEAINDFDKLIELNHNSSYAYALRGSASLLLHRFDDAMRDLDKAIDLSPRYSWAYSRRSLLNLYMGRYSEALNDNDHAISNDTGNGFIFFDRARILISEQQYNEAESVLLKSTSLSKDDKYQRVWLYFTEWKVLGKETAVESLKTYQKNRPKEQDDFTQYIIDYLLGEITENQFKDQANSFSARSHDENLCEVFFYMGMNYLWQGDLPKTKQYWERCIQTEIRNFIEYEYAFNNINKPLTEFNKLSEVASKKVLAERNQEAEDPPELVPYETGPVPVKQQTPDYPEEALKKKIEGIVWVKAIITKDGKVKKAYVVKSDNTILNNSAVKAMSESSFKPAMHAGQPVATWVSVPYTFKLNH